MFDIDENKKATSGKTARAGTVLSESKRKAAVENPVLIVGPCNAGKTALFYKLFAGDLKETVSSVAENSTRNNKMPLKFDEQLAMTCVDIPGHFNFRYRIEELLDQGAKAVVLVVDSKDRNKMAEAAEILYDTLNNLTVLEHKPPILVACNKTDLQFSKTKVQVRQELEKEIEEIRKVRRATQDDQDTGKENVVKAGFLESVNSKKRFTFAEMQDQLAPVTFVETSLVNDKLEGVYDFLRNDVF